MKKNRHSEIIDLIDKYEIETQEELAERLKAAGYQVTQATVSRDIRALHLSKIPCGNGKQTDPLQSSSESGQVPHQKELRYFADGEGRIHNRTGA